MAAEIRLHASARRRGMARHPWVFRDHITAGSASPGAVVRVVDAAGRQLGFATYSPESKIALRFLAIGEHVKCPTSESLRATFHAAVSRRSSLLAVTDAVRLVSSEADGLPGLIVDRYNDVVVLQALTPFAEFLEPSVVEWLAETVAPGSVLARNDGAVRRLEGLPQEVRWLHGPEVGEVEVREGELRFRVDLVRGQKTGMFLDQRANRLRFGGLVGPEDRVLDAFCYIGGFALHAARRAREVLAIDDSRRAVDQTLANAQLNGLGNVRCEKGNTFHLLRDLAREKEVFDAVVLDPPAFAKSRKEIESARRGYHEINLRALRLLRPGGLLVSASCSYQVSESMFEEMLRGAAADAGRDVTVLKRRGQDSDHPVWLSLPESRYLKCYFLTVC